MSENWNWSSLRISTAARDRVYSLRLHTCALQFSKIHAAHVILQDVHVLCSDVVTRFLSQHVVWLVVLESAPECHRAREVWYNCAFHLPLVEYMYTSVDVDIVDAMCCECFRYA